MSDLPIVLAIVYTLGVVATAMWGLLDWNLARSMQRDDLRELQKPSSEWRTSYMQERCEEYEHEARAGARRFVQSPLWPLLAVGALVRIYADSKEGS